MKGLLNQFREIGETLGLTSYVDDDYAFERNFSSAHDTTYWVNLENGASLGLLSIVEEASLEQLSDGTMPVRYIALQKTDGEVSPLRDFREYAWDNMIRTMKQQHKISTITKSRKINELTTEKDRIARQVMSLEASMLGYTQRYEEIEAKYEDFVVEFRPPELFQDPSLFVRDSEGLIMDKASEVVNYLGLGPDSCDKIRELYNLYARSESPKGNTDIILSGCIYIAGVLLGKRRTQNEISQVMPLSSGSVSRSYRRIARALDIRLEL